MSTSTAPRLHDRQVDVETPEHVAIGYQLADLGSRFTALLIDRLILLLAQAGVFLAAYLVWRSSGGSGSLFSGVGLAIAIAAYFVLQWGYFILYEGLRDGQTPGKRWMGLRVVQDGGYPVTLEGAAVRNLMRLIDVQPIPSCIVGGLAMTLHPQTKRLGDMAAGTVVVRDRGQRIPEEAAPAAAVHGPPRLSDKEFAALSMFVERRRDLDPAVRGQLARTLVARLARSLEEDPRRTLLASEDFLIAAREDEAARRHAAGAGGIAGSAQATALVRRQRPEWDEYARLLEGAQKDGLRKLDEATVSRFASLYRGVAADLARARTYGGSPELLYALERSVGAGHNLLYRAPSRSWQRFRGWVLSSFPALVRRLWKPIVLASILFYLPGILSFAYVRGDPARGRELVGAEMMARAEEAAAKEARGEGYVEVPEVMMPAMASGLVSNNVQVTFLAFAGGLLAGLGTVWVLVFNGVSLGSVAAVFANHGQSLHLWTFVLPHGVVELTAICIAGGAGLWLGSALVLPGRITRREALVVRGREAVSLICGTALLLLVAGLIEGFISPSRLPREFKLGFAALVAVVLFTYLGSAGRAPSPRPPPPPAGAQGG
ncbi:MAG TPA: stage II sporulation protein M [Longimicrobium sp.]|jgi:uncharacterized membrane protein SpoIIM required for sporulation/uncharacterized RDD family membrane protein YckC